MNVQYSGAAGVIIVDDGQCNEDFSRCGPRAGSVKDGGFAPMDELLDVLQEQMEEKHAVTLEWIVIWLIVVEIVIEVVSIVGQVSGLWSVGR